MTINNMSSSDTQTLETVYSSVLYYYSTIVIMDLQYSCKFTDLLATNIASKLPYILQ